jgi:hypothetical protein
MIGWFPTTRAEIRNTALPRSSTAVPSKPDSLRKGTAGGTVKLSGLEASKKPTVPVQVDGETVTMRPTVCPYRDGFGVEEIVTSGTETAWTIVPEDLGALL